MEENSIVLENVSKRFKDQIVLEHVNAEFQPGHIYGIIGHNGSGKTLLFKMICGFVLPTEGEVLVYGKRLDKNNCFPKETGVVIEKSGLIENYTAHQNLKYLTKLCKNVDDNIIEQTLLEVGLEPKSKKKYKNFSLGMKQKLSIAQAILEYPKILVLDEPFNSLDEDSISKVKEILLSFKREGKLILIASHNSIDIDELCDKKFKIQNGKLVLI